MKIKTTFFMRDNQMPFLPSNAHQVIFLIQLDALFTKQVHVSKTVGYIF
jgi:hypothetical protein